MAKRIGSVLVVIFCLWPTVGRADAAAGPSLPALAQARAEAAGRAYAAVEAEWRSGKAPLDALYLWSIRWYGSARAANVPGASAEHLKRMKGIEQLVKVKVSMGVAPVSDSAQAAFYRSEAELFAAEAGGANQVATPKK
jgi:hypothetical protein